MLDHHLLGEIKKKSNPCYHWLDMTGDLHLFSSWETDQDPNTIFLLSRTCLNHAGSVSLELQSHSLHSTCKVPAAGCCTPTLSFQIPTGGGGTLLHTHGQPPFYTFLSGTQLRCSMKENTTQSKYRINR